MNINLSETEIEILLAVLGEYLDERGIDDRSWLHRQDRAADLDSKLRKTLKTERDSPEKPERTRHENRGEAMCSNDPVEW
jgi:hypothetical protein